MGKALQSHKIKQIGEALVAAGVSNLDAQASALGLCRSTTWALLQATHKHSGLSAGVVKTILQSKRLPPDVRSKVVEYVEEKISGRYGHQPLQISRFAAQLGISKQIGRSRGFAVRLQNPAHPERAVAEATNGRFYVTKGI